MCSRVWDSRGRLGWRALSCIDGEAGSQEQEYLAYHYLNNSNAKMHSQLMKDVANDYSKGNTDECPNDIHKALTLVQAFEVGFSSRPCTGDSLCH